MAQHKFSDFNLDLAGTAYYDLDELSAHVQQQPTRRRTEPAIGSNVTIEGQSDMLHDSTLLSQPQGGLPYPWDSSSTNALNESTLQDLSRPTSISLEMHEARVQAQAAGAASLQAGNQSHGFEIGPSQPFEQSHSTTPSARASPLRRSTVTMSNQGYPPSSYSGTHTPILPNDISASAQDPYPPGTHFFHTDFLPISPQESQEQGNSATNAHLIAIEEEKRRRNTAASARFRIKKKEREQALEKTATEMSEKVAVLETRVAQLELENKWLRGLITEKSRKMTNAEGVSGSGSVSVSGASGKSKARKKSVKDEESQRSPSRRTDGVGTK